MSTAIETLLSRHKVSWKGWVVTLTAAALLAGAIGTYMALQGGGSASPPRIIQTAKPATVAPVKNLQPGSTGQVFPNRIDGQYLPTPIAQHEGAAKTGGKTDAGSIPTSAPGTPPPNCLRGGPC